MISQTEIYLAIRNRSQVIFNTIFKGKYSFPFWISLPFVLCLAARILSQNFGDSDGYITGGARWSVHDTLFLLLYLVPVAVYYKLKDLGPLKISRILLVAFPIAFLIRIFLASLGGNFDLESYNIVADIVLSGKSVYANTWRYNYGPVWAYVLAGCKYIALNFDESGKVFHYLIVTVLFSAESFIGYQLYKKYKDARVLLFFLLNPIGLVISGYHSQFDIIAIAVGFAAVLQLNKNNILKACLLLGLSLVIKHILVFFAFFLWFDKNLSIKNKIILTVLPIYIFLISFIPFYNDLGAIRDNVFGYTRGINKGIFPQLLQLIIPEQVVKTALFTWLPVFKGWMFVWLLTMLSMGYVAARYCKQYIMEMYLLALVFTSVAFADQYLYIPVLAIAVFYRYYASWVYTFLGGFYLFFLAYDNLRPQQWLKIFSIDVERDDLHFKYPVVQFWLLVLLVAVIRKQILASKEIS